MTWILSVLRVCFLVVALILTFYISWGFGFYTLLLGALTNNHHIGLLILLLPFVILFLVVSYFRQIWDFFLLKSLGNTSPVAWKCTPQSVCCREGLNAIIVTVMATLISIGCIIPFMRIVPVVTQDYLTQLEMRQLGYELKRSLSPVATVIWLIVALCLYRYEAWAQQRRSRRKAAKAKRQSITPTQTKTSLVDPVDVELDRLRGQMGLTQVRKSKPKA